MFLFAESYRTRLSESSIRPRSPKSGSCLERSKSSRCGASGGFSTRMRPEASHSGRRAGVRSNGVGGEHGKYVLHRTGVQMPAQQVVTVGRGRVGHIVEQRQRQIAAGAVKLTEVFREAHFVADAHADFPAAKGEHARRIARNEVVPIPAPQRPLGVDQRFLAGAKNHHRVAHVVFSGNHAAHDKRQVPRVGKLMQRSVHFGKAGKIHRGRGGDVARRIARQRAFGKEQQLCSRFRRSFGRSADCGEIVFSIACDRERMGSDNHDCPSLSILSSVSFLTALRSAVR